MEILNQQEVEQVSGARISVSQAVGATLSLMALGAASPFVIGAGAVALIAYAWM